MLLVHVPAEPIRRDLVHEGDRRARRELSSAAGGAASVARPNPAVRSSLSGAARGFRWVRALPRARERRWSSRATRRHARRGEGFVADPCCCARSSLLLQHTPSRTHIRRRFTVWCAAIVLSRRGRTDLLREVVDPVVELLRPLAPQLAPADHEDVLLRHVLLVPAQRHRRTSSSSSSSS